MAKKLVFKSWQLQLCRSKNSKPVRITSDTREAAKLLRRKRFIIRAVYLPSGIFKTFTTDSEFLKFKDTVMRSTELGL